MKSITWQPSAVKDLERLDAKLRNRIIAAVERYANEQQGDVKKLKGMEDQWRLRVGNWRVRFTLQEEPMELVILRILPRGSAYR